MLFSTRSLQVLNIWKVLQNVKIRLIFNVHFGIQVMFCLSPEQDTSTPQ